MPLTEKVKNLTFNNALLVAVIALIIGIQLAYFIQTPIKTFPDTGSYSQFDPFKLTSWLGGNRTFVLPIVIWIFGKNHSLVTAFQYIVSSLAMIYFFIALDRFFENIPTKLIIFTILIGYFLSGSIVTWNSCILTESLSFSFFLISFALSLELLRTKKNLYLYTLVASIIALVFTRNFNLMFALSLSPLFFFMMYKYGFKNKIIIKLALILAVIFSYALYSNSLSDSMDFPFTNIISTRSMPQKDNSMMNYFLANGFPKHIPKYDFKKDMYAISHSKSPEIKKWVKNGGEKVYLKYLITNPNYTLLMPFSMKSIANSFNFSWSQSVIGYILLSMYVNYTGVNFELINGLKFLVTVTLKSFEFYPILFLLALLVSTYYSIFQNKNYRNLYLVGAYIMLTGLSTTLLSWHLDSMEILRHTILAAMIFYIGFTLYFCALVQSIGEIFYKLFLSVKSKINKP